MSGRTLLLVEDQALIAMSLSIELRRLGYEVLVAPTAARAIELATQTDIDYCAMDVNLPGGKDGIEASIELRALGRYPILFVTGYDDPSYRARAAELSQSAYLLKPITARQLHEELQKLAA